MTGLVVLCRYQMTKVILIVHVHEITLQDNNEMEREQTEIIH